MRRLPDACCLSNGVAAVIVAVACQLSGCGSTKARVATEQLLASDAVDRAVADIDFRPLAGRSVYLNTDYIKDIRSKSNRTIGFVDENYVISSLRQQIIGCGCQLQDKPEDAELVVEARVGTLGTDSREIVYGLPASNALSAAASAASALGAAPPVPAVPEISLGRRDDHSAAAKVAAFAYDRKTRRPVWQSGLAVARSDAKDTYLLGAGPFQRGSIYRGEGSPQRASAAPASAVAFDKPYVFPVPSEPPATVQVVDAVQTAGHEEPAD